ncbi:catabolite repressor/activator [Zooshikella harenae]|uniref:Catabolite repressor/activator n=1 Tax=Zooshikella harenae TaxID=2827238 RepID=A0ABS5Z9Q9_9GAMM|nr:catabolite repressor/activator [Zooshikella harenae]MBU2710780.1 catabolite repressor/activator [Zooshikella harenae]
MRLEEIAKLAGVSKSTVSYVINGKADKYRISQRTQEKVLSIVNQYGFRPNDTAAALRRGKSNTFGFITPDFENRSYLRIAKRLEQLARTAGYQLIIASSDDDPATELEVAKMLSSRNIDLLMVSSCLGDDVDYYQRLNKQGLLIIGLDRPLPSSDFISVISDDQHGAETLVSSLDLSQAKNVVMLSAMPELTISKQREAGFRKALMAYPNITPHCFYGDHYSRSVGKSLFHQAVDNLGCIPDAIITTSYTLMEGILAVLADSTWFEKCQHCQLATFGNSRALDLLPIKINSLPQQYDLIAEQSWQLAMQAINGEYAPQREVIPRSLIVRR